MEFLFRPRSSGKRQVKPSQDLALLEDTIAHAGGDDESDDDSEFRVDGGSSSEGGDRGDDEESDSDTSDDDDSEDDQDEDEGEEEDKVEDDELLLLKKDLSTDELLRLAQASKARDTKLFKQKVCGCCLGTTSSDANEIVECDGCGVSVHEACYGVAEEANNVEPGKEDEVSEASTEPWFCEPCKAGVDPTLHPPPCDLCPNMGGLYKETDVGRWVHLVCALYTPGVAFADPERLTRVTLFEMNYAQWGRRACSICEENRIARTGVCVQCDAGLCRSYFHVSCAQKNGLLSEPSYHEAVTDAYLAHCKFHTDKTVIRRRKQNFQTFALQTRNRAEFVRHREECHKVSACEPSDARILRKLSLQRARFQSDRIHRTGPWIPTRKLPRALSTSASAIRKMEKSTEIAKGISAERQRLEEQMALSVIEAKKKWHIAPNFSVEYVAYYHDRQKRLEDLRRKLTSELKRESSLRDLETTARPKFELASTQHSSIRETNSELRSLIKSYRDTLEVLGGKALPECKALKEEIPAVTQQNSFLKSVPNSPPSLSMNSCSVCHRTRDQHKLVHCDTCRLYTHLGCLSPPLTRMPKKSKLYGWQCSKCDKGSSSNEEMPTPEEGQGQRKKRLAATKALAAASRQNSDTENEIWEQQLALQQHIVAAPPKRKKPDTSDDDIEITKEVLIASTSAKAREKEERRKKRKMEKEERKKIRKEMKKKRKEKEKEQAAAAGGDDSECEIIEENGQVIVNIKPKPIKLKIKTPGLSNGKVKVKDRDERTRCDTCDSEGTNSNLVRCDECQRCFHFSCLDPPVKNSPKVAGYGWNCRDCSPSEVDSDWHLD